MCWLRNAQVDWQAVGFCALLIEPHVATEECLLRYGCVLLYLELELCGSRQQLGLQQKAHLAATQSRAPWLVSRELQPDLLVVSWRLLQHCCCIAAARKQTLQLCNLQVMQMRMQHANCTQRFIPKEKNTLR